MQSTTEPGRACAAQRPDNCHTCQAPSGYDDKRATTPVIHSTSVRERPVPGTCRPCLTRTRHLPGTAGPLHRLTPSSAPNPCREPVPRSDRTGSACARHRAGTAATTPQRWSPTALRCTKARCLARAASARHVPASYPAPLKSVDPPSQARNQTRAAQSPHRYRLCQAPGGHGGNRVATPVNHDASVHHGAAHGTYRVRSTRTRQLPGTVGGSYPARWEAP